ncbi:MAG: FtsX-like permease family protein [Oceanococcaceae bacterium]
MNARALTAACLVLATAVAASTGALSERITRLLLDESAATLGGDRVAVEKSAFADELLAAARGEGLATSIEVSLPTLAFVGDRSELIGLRAVDEQWPLRGAVRLRNAVADSPRPQPGEAWVAVTLLDALQAQPGDMLEIGTRTLRIAEVIEDAPGRGNAGFASLAPQVLIARADLDNSGLLAEGARTRWYLYLAGEAAALARFAATEAATDVRLSEPGEIRPEIGNALDRAGALLDLATLCSLVLLAAVIFLLGRYRYVAWAYETAVLRSLGAQRSDILRRLGGPWAWQALLAIALGVGLAVLGQWVLGAVVFWQRGLQLPDAGLYPHALAAAASLCIAAVQLPQLWRAADTPPARLLRQTHAARRQLLMSGLWSALMLLLVGLAVNSDARVLLGSVGVVLGGGLVMAGLALLILRLLPTAGPLTALGQVQRQGSMAALQVGVLGLGLSILLLLTGLQRQIIAPWQAQLPPDAPNRFIINIQPEQQQSLADILSARGIDNARLVPMVRGRLIGLNGQPVTADDFDDPETQRWINRDFNLSRAATLPGDNELLEGAFWPVGSERYEMSITDYGVERLDLRLGSTLTLDVAGTEYEYTVTSVRKVNWDSMQPNFFLLVPPAALPAAGANWITSYFQPDAQAGLDRELMQQFPNLTVLNLERLIAEIRRITGRALAALQFVFSFTLVSGGLLVVSMLLGQLPARRQQVAVLRALGISRSRLRALTCWEFAGLGALAGVGAVVMTQISLGILATQVFELPWQPAWADLLWPPLVAAIAASGLGWWMLKPATLTPPAQLLREA